MANPNLNNLTSIYGGTASVTIGTAYTEVVAAPSDTVYKVNSILVSSCTTGSGDTITVLVNNNPYAIKTLANNTVMDFVINKPLYVLEGTGVKIKKEGDSGSEPLYCSISYEVLSDA